MLAGLLDVAHDSFKWDPCSDSALFAPAAPELDRDGSGEPFLPGPSCPILYPDEASLERRRPSHVGARPFACHVCPMTFSKNFKWDPCSDSALFAPAAPELDRDGSGEPFLPGPSCPILYPDEASLERRRPSHVGARPFACHVCPMTFSKKWNLMRHVRAHTGERRFGCIRCHGTFTEKAR
ncbi:zinc finger protein, putative [Ixodes scapularis]|uniref:Zinc finger protein, putative n=1 Tax=Ixodes scapularis TaxID=6945 RepID=B7PQ69_IXOSC|nr:zinc finger protein, putative [Ixodes scapularis]|eukprot:XP_002435911.1 zinc finger protein, putative [Ixodes scapularis]